MSFSTRLLRGLWLLCFFACPLLFFTDLTRNPYVTQTVLLNLALLAALAVCSWSGARAGEWTIPATALDIPLAAWIAVCGSSWLWAYFHHAPFFHGAMRSEGLKAAAFLLTGTVLPFYMGASCARRSGGSPSSSAPGRWASFLLAWGGLWTMFPGLRGAAGPPMDVVSHLWDPYGAMLWIAGFCVLMVLAREGTLHDYWHAALGVAFLSSVYGILQYFGVEYIWPKALNPYGGRSVSTFGNPNFMSSYMVIFLPAAVLYYLKARRWSERLAYAAVCLAMEGSLLSSLTRSSWLGAAAGLGFLIMRKPVRELALERWKIHAGMLGIAVVTAVLWPRTSVLGSTPTVFGRIAELGAILDVKTAQPYSPFYQRVLIWACAWLMGRENPLLGKGWGLFETFYPFYQGHLLAQFDFFRIMRTHGNGAHNELLEAWSQTGLLGVGALIWIWTAFFTSVCRRNRPAAGNEWGWAAAAGAAGMLADNLLNVSLHFPVPAFAFWWQAGAAMGLVRPAAGGCRRWPFEGRGGRAAAFAAAMTAASCCALGGWWWIRQWNREAYYFAGFKLFHGGQTNPAVDALETAYRWHPREVNTDYELGNAYARSGRLDRALWAYGEALESNAGYDEIYYNAAVLLARLGRREEALEYFQTAHWINPLSADIYSGLSALYMKDLARFEPQAIPLLEQAARYFPDHPAFLANLGYLYGLRREDAKAQELWTRTLRINPELDIAERNLRVLLARRGGPRAPILEDLGLYRDLLARVGRKDYSRAALEEARRAAAAFPDCPKTSFLLGSLELMSGRPEEALKSLESLALRDSRNAAVWRNLGEAYLRLGRRREAVSAFRSALQLEPGDAPARERLRRLAQGP